MAATPEEAKLSTLSPNPSLPDDESVESVESTDRFQGLQSDCGFGDSMHEALMAAGKAVHSIVGEPPSMLRFAMSETGDFVKDTAVAMHDLSQADGGIINEETHELIKMMTSKDDSTKSAVVPDVEVVKEEKEKEAL